MTTETNKKTEEKITIPMSERRPLRVLPSEWPLIASAHDYDNQYDFQANRHWRIKVRQHADGRTAVHGTYTSQFQGERGAEGGYLLTDDEANGGDGSGLIRAIRRVAGIIERPELAQECISDLPPDDDADDQADATAIAADTAARSAGLKQVFRIGRLETGSLRTETHASAEEASAACADDEVVVYEWVLPLTL